MNNLLNQLGLPPMAVRYLLDLWLVIQAWDDVVDGDEIPREIKDRSIYASLVSIPGNPFYTENQMLLLPLISNSVLKWKAADTAEREGKPSAMSFSWRAGYYDVVLQVVSIVHGPDVAMQNAHNVMALYGESFEDYVKEFKNA
jgi:hypothetical protein